MPEDRPILPEVDDLVLRCCSVVGPDKPPPSPSVGNGGNIVVEDDREEREAIQAIDGDADPAGVAD